ncbi:pyridoxamine 5'-phosphate oxidase family protein [Nocardia sp. CA2R105]|uniref:pyridoxamine 5'-phosphate oxidase family protein n=1 Tax=Nocardia coffeae TaxID=2873381 RepID=UPI001CA75617|nr:pyridoxamine 5'-phosphate oxidase family protein [Nocardia coffeae]MBY8857183.1 pyridoxamine 5'-phosphate oxidase family protein [Nocardia coffeae]
MSIDSDPPQRPTGPPEDGMIALDSNECLTLLAGVRLGRVLYTRDALPAVRPVNHVVRDGEVIVGAGATPWLTDMVRARDKAVLGYQADQIDPDSHRGWTVRVVGYARIIDDPDRIAVYAPLVRSWTRTANDALIAIEPDLVTGMRLAESTGV